MLKIINITAAYHHGHPILSDVSLELGSGERLAILGRNGAGKTTFANSIFGLTPLVGGTILYNERSILPLPPESIAALGLGYFMQGAPIFPQMSARDNLLMAAGKMNKKDLGVRYRELREIFTLLKEPGIENMPAGSLSGGERTQLALAMAIFKKPSLLVLDEPFAGLSPANANNILHILDDYQTSANASVILIAQDRQLASVFCDLHYVIRDGRIIPY